MKVMETRSFTPQAPVMPAVWPSLGIIKPVKRRFPNTVDEPKTIGYYLEPLKNIGSRPDRSKILKEFCKETYV